MSLDEVIQEEAVSLPDIAEESDNDTSEEDLEYENLMEPHLHALVNCGNLSDTEIVKIYCMIGRVFTRNDSYFSVSS